MPQNRQAFSAPVNKQALGGMPCTRMFTFQYRVRASDGPLALLRVSCVSCVFWMIEARESVPSVVSMRGGHAYPESPQW